MFRTSNISLGIGITLLDLAFRKTIGIPLPYDIGNIIYSRIKYYKIKKNKNIIIDESLDLIPKGSIKKKWKHYKYPKYRNKQAFRFVSSRYES